MKMHASLLLILFACSSAFADDAPAPQNLTYLQIAPIEGEKCVTVPIEDLLDAMTAYDEYATIDGVYKPGELMPQWGSSEFQEIDMVESQAQFLEVKATDPAAKKYSEMKDAYVKVALQPLTLGVKYKAVYPQFLMRCKSGWVGAEHHGRFEQSCQLVPSKLNFAVRRFTLALSATQGCGKDGTGVNVKYTLLITTIQEHVEAIKSAISAQNSFPKTVIDLLFNQETFFSKYFTFFYERGMAWAKTRSDAKKTK